MRYLVLAVATLVCWSPVFADSIEIAASEDSGVYSGYQNTNFPYLRAGGTQAVWETRSYLAFDTYGLIPSGSTITGVNLNLYVTGGGGAGLLTNPEPVAAFEAAGSWTETGITWNNQPGISGGTTALDTQSISMSSFGNWVSWDVKSAWAEVPQLDLLLEDAELFPGGQNEQEVFFGAREDGAVIAPYLEITYDLPPQGSGGTSELPANALLGLSMIPMGLAWLRRRGKR